MVIIHIMPYKYLSNCWIISVNGSQTLGSGHYLRPGGRRKFFEEKCVQNFMCGKKLPPLVFLKYIYNYSILYSLQVCVYSQISLCCNKKLHACIMKLRNADISTLKTWLWAWCTAHCRKHPLYAYTCLTITFDPITLFWNFWVLFAISEVLQPFLTIFSDFQ